MVGIWYRNLVLLRLTFYLNNKIVNLWVLSSGSGLELTDNTKRVSFLTMNIYVVISWPIVLMFLRSLRIYDTFAISLFIGPLVTC